MGGACDQLFMAVCLLVIEVCVRKAYKVVSDPVTLVKRCPSKQRRRQSINMSAVVSQFVVVSSKDVRYISLNMQMRKLCNNVIKKN